MNVRRALLLAVPLFAVVQACDCNPDPVVRTTCEFAVDPSGEGDAIDFGSVEVGDNAAKAWKLTNNSEGVSLVDLVITFESVNGEHYSIELPDDVRIAPGDDETFTVVFAPVAESAQLASRFTVSHADVGNAECNTVTVFLRGAGTLPLEVDAGPEDAGVVDGGFLDGGPVTDAGVIETPDAGVVLPPGGEWFAYGAFEEARARFATVELIDGTGDVLAIGGYGEDGVALDSIERFNVQTGVSRVVARMAVPRAEPAAALLADGKVIILGGRSSALAGFALRTIERFDPVDDSLACLDVGGCGLEDQSNAILPIGRIGAIAHTLGSGDVAVMLGKTLDNEGNEVPEPGADVVDVTGTLALGPALGGAQLLGARLGVATVVDPVTNNLLLVGGRSGGGQVLGDVLKLDEASASVSSLPGLNFPRAFASGATLREVPNDGDVVIAGGFGGTNVGVPEVELIEDAFDGAATPVVVEDLDVDVRVGGSLLALAGDILLWAGGTVNRTDNRNVDESVLPQTSAEIIISFGTDSFLRFAADNDLAQGRFEHQALVVSPPDAPALETALFLGGVATSPRRTPHPQAERYVLAENRFLTYGLMGDGTALEAGVMANVGAALISAGGVDPHTGRTSSAIRAFDAINGVFVEDGELNEPRRDHTLTRISVAEDNSMLVAGGRDDSGAVIGSLSIVDTVNKIDRPLPISLRVPRANHTATRLADNNPIAPGAVVLCGGQGAGGESLDSCEVFIPPSNPLNADTYDEAEVFLVLGRLSAGRVSHTATLLDTGEVLIAGGGDVSVDLVTADLFVPDADDSFVRATGEPVLARRGHAAVFLGSGRVLLVGGEVSDGAGGVGATDQAELYVRASESFLDVGDMEAQRGSPAAFLLGDGNVLVTGGHRFNESDGVPTRSNTSSELYVVTADGTGEFELLNDTPLSFGRSDLLFVDVFGRAMVIGGAHRDGVLATGDERKTPLTFIDWLQDPADAFQP
jgi:hypothetical protein